MRWRKVGTVYERLERFAQLPATRVCAPFVLGGLLLLVAFAGDTQRALQASGLVSLLATCVLIRDAGGFDMPENQHAAVLNRHLLNAALHAAMFAASFLLAALGMAAFSVGATG